jgi:hypothetical protein
MDIEYQGGAKAVKVTGKRCFVLMPFSQTTERHTKEYWDWFFDGFIRQALEPRGYTVSRSQATTGNITRNIMLDLALADLVVAVLTDKSPNVLWELGVRHFARNGTICLIEKGGKRDFDLCVHGSLEYEDFRFEKFREDIKPFLESADRDVSDSPVSDFLNNGPNFCMHYAAATLQRLQMLIETLPPPLDEADEHKWFRERLEGALSEFQGALDRKYNAQVTIVELKVPPKILFHRDPNEIGKDPTVPKPDIFWSNFCKPNQSYFEAMVVIRRGLRLGYIKDYEDRLSALAFDTLLRPKWLVVSEAHDARPLQPMLKS